MLSFYHLLISLHSAASTVTSLIIHDFPRYFQFKALKYLIKSLTAVPRLGILNPYTPPGCSINQSEVLFLKEHFNITGMSCSACSAHVEKSVAKLPGIKNVTVNLLANNMTVDYDETQLSSAQICTAVENAGYGASPQSSENKKSD